MKMKNYTDIELLAGAENQWQDLCRTSQISLELFRGFQRLRNTSPCITIFGSSRFTEDNPYYVLARQVGLTLGAAGFNVMTGGGPGIMEAANRGAQEAGAHSVGCNIELLCEQKENPYLDLSVTFDHFFVRKVMLLKYSCAFVILPGGFGTMDEIFETLNLIETKKIAQFPLVIMGRDYWQPMKTFIERSMVPAGTISSKDAERCYFTDDPQIMLDYIIANIPEKTRPILENETHGI